jgi:hypothetical protein
MVLTVYGVILITTKKGKKENKIRFSNQLGIPQPLTLKYLSGSQYTDLRNEY